MIGGGGQVRPANSTFLVIEDECREEKRVQSGVAPKSTRSTVRVRTPEVSLPILVSDADRWS